MWCVNINAENQGQNPKFDFTNKVGKFLGLDISKIAGNAATDQDEVDAVVGGELSGWKFSPVFKNGVEKSVLYSYFTNDSVIGLKIVEEEGVKTVKMVKALATTEKIDAAKFTEFELVKADQITIKDRNDFNSIFGSQVDSLGGVKLTFDKDVKGEGIVNPFNTKKS